MSTEQAKSGPGQYECEMCHGIFDFGWSNEEAKAEAEGKGLDVADCGIVCDDCYKKTPWGAVEANGLDVAAIHPSKGAKYSPNLHALLTKRDKKHRTWTSLVFSDKDGTLWIGMIDLGDTEIDKLRKTLGTAIAWLRQEYGDAAMHELLCMLGPDAPNSVLDRLPYK